MSCSPESLRKRKTQFFGTKNRRCCYKQHRKIAVYHAFKRWYVRTQLSPLLWLLTAIPLLCSGSNFPGLQSPTPGGDDSTSPSPGIIEQIASCFKSCVFCVYILNFYIRTDATPTAVSKESEYLSIVTLYYYITYNHNKTMQQS